MNNDILRIGAKARTKLDRLQAEREQNAKELHAAELGPISVVEARARLASALERPVEDAAFAFESLLRPERGHVALPQQITMGELAYLQGKDAFIDNVMERIAGKAGLPAEQRAARVDALRRKLRDVHIAEEKEILDLERRGHTVLRRGDADVSILLDVWRDLAIVEPEPVPASA